MYELRFEPIGKDDAQYEINWAIIPTCSRDALEDHILNMVTPCEVTTHNHYDVRCVVVAEDDKSTEYYYYSVRSNGTCDPIGWCSEDSGYLCQSGTYKVSARVAE